MALLALKTGAEGCLVPKPQALKTLTFGIDEAGYHPSEAAYRLETGKAYEL
jgi:hypothetical protein